MGTKYSKCPKCGSLFLMMGKYRGEWYQDCVICGYVAFLDLHRNDALATDDVAAFTYEE